MDIPQNNNNVVVPLTCKMCDKVCTADDFYQYKTKQGMKSLHKCKVCHNAGNYTKKPTGWAKIAPDVQVAVIAKLAVRSNKVKDIAEEFGISASCLNRWVTAGKCI